KKPQCPDEGHLLKESGSTHHAPLTFRLTITTTCGDERSFLDRILRSKKKYRRRVSTKHGTSRHHRPTLNNN
ncbi:hypothetical protein HAX54_020091, partial [Datura stramonium]|nr:hypothetical protein [Datura stramonium]